MVKAPRIKNIIFRGVLKPKAISGAGLKKPKALVINRGNERVNRKIKDIRYIEACKKKKIVEREEV